MKWNLYEKIWLSCFVSISLILTILWKDTFFGFSVFLTGVLCVVLAAKGNIWTYVFGMYNTFGYAYLAYTNKLFGELSLNLLFFVPMNILGYIMWKKKLEDKIVKMRKLTLLTQIKLALLSFIGVLALGFFLSKIEGQNTPYIDAITNVLSVVATFLMIWRYREQWVFYIILNIFSVLMWTYRTYYGGQDGSLMVLMWSAYLVNSFYGYYNWSKGVEEKLVLGGNNE